MKKRWWVSLAMSAILSVGAISVQAIGRYDITVADTYAVIRRDAGVGVWGHTAGDDKHPLAQVPRVSTQLLTTLGDDAVYLDVPPSFHWQATKGQIQSHKNGKVLEYDVEGAEGQQLQVFVYRNESPKESRDKKIASLMKKGKDELGATIDYDTAFLKEKARDMAMVLGNKYMSAEIQADMVDNRLMYIMFMKINPYYLGERGEGDVLMSFTRVGDDLVIVGYTLNNPDANTLHSYRHSLFTLNIVKKN